LKNLDVKIGTKEESKWTKIKDRAEKNIEDAETEIEINEAIVMLAEERLKMEAAIEKDDKAGIA